MLLYNTILIQYHHCRRRRRRQCPLRRSLAVVIVVKVRVDKKFGIKRCWCFALFTEQVNKQKKKCVVFSLGGKFLQWINKNFSNEHIIRCDLTVAHRQIEYDFGIFLFVVYVFHNILLYGPIQSVWTNLNDRKFNELREKCLIVAQIQVITCKCITELGDVIAMDMDA